MYEMTDMERRWNKAAGFCGYAGSEYHNEPERIFREVRELRNEMHRLRVENVRLRRGEGGSSATARRVDL